MRVVSWNMNKRKADNWEWLIDEVDPDIALVQEASPLPDGLKATVRDVKKNTALSSTRRPMMTVSTVCPWALNEKGHYYPEKRKPQGFP